MDQIREMYEVLFKVSKSYEGNKTGLFYKGCGGTVSS